MTAPELETPQAAGAARRKPRLVLMGEFSAGKSTLSNILLGGAPLPMQVTATRLPPVYISHGEPSAFAIDVEGTRHDIDLDDLSYLSPDDVLSIHLTLLADTLELCDLIDMPGISDPNMAVDTWDDVVGAADHVVWCTHATQAWRQSEAALWDRIREATTGRNLLLINQWDKLRSPRDRERVLARVKAEVKGKFEAVYPISLLEALAAEEDFEAWKASGAAAFMDHLIEIMMGAPGQHQPEAADAAPAPAQTEAAPEDSEGFEGSESSVVRLNFHITPRRVHARPGAHDRPARLPPQPAPADAGART